MLRQYNFKQDNLKCSFSAVIQDQCNWTCSRQPGSAGSCKYYHPSVNLQHHPVFQCLFCSWNPCWSSVHGVTTHLNMTDDFRSVESRTTADDRCTCPASLLTTTSKLQMRAQATSCQAGRWLLGERSKKGGNTPAWEKIPADLRV